MQGRARSHVAQDLLDLAVELVVNVLFPRYVQCRVVYLLENKGPLLILSDSASFDPRKHPPPSLLDLKELLLATTELQLFGGVATEVDEGQQGEEYDVEKHDDEAVEGGRPGTLTACLLSFHFIYNYYYRAARLVLIIR